MSGTVGTPVSLQIQAADSAPGETLTFTATGLPTGLSINSSTGLISGTPTSAATYSVVVTATDTTGAYGTAAFTWTVVDLVGNVVTVTPQPNRGGTVGTATSLQIVAADSVGDPLTYTATGLPAGLSINSSTGLISGTPTTAAAYTTTATATDTTSASGSTTFTWTVTAAATTVLFGANVGGWFTGAYANPVGTKENQTAAFTRLVSQLGHIEVVRDWTHGLAAWSTVTAAWGTRGVVIEVPTSVTPSALATWLAAAPTDRPIWWCWQHEPEAKTTPAAFKTGWAPLAAAAKAAAPANVKSTIILQGTSYIPSRYGWVGGHAWSEWMPTGGDLANLDHVGADVYHFGKTDALSDSAAFVLNPVVAAAASLSKRVLIGEYGLVRVQYPVWPTSPYWTDAMRAQRITEAMGIFKNPANNIDVVLLFEADNGAQSNGAPHNQFGPPPGQTAPWPQQGLTAWLDGIG